MLKLRHCMIGSDLKLYTKEQASHSLTLNPKLFDYYFLLSRLLYLLIYATIPYNFDYTKWCFLTLKKLTVLPY